MVGAFYNPHLGAELAQAAGIDHLAMADPPTASDPWWPAIRGRYTLLLHDYLGQLSEPLDERSIQRARGLAELYRSPWVAEHFQCLHTQDAGLGGPWIAPAEPSDEMLAFAAHAVSRCPRAKAVTFDAFSPSLTAEVLFQSVERIRGAL